MTSKRSKDVAGSPTRANSTTGRPPLRVLALTEEISKATLLAEGVGDWERDSRKPTQSFHHHQLGINHALICLLYTNTTRVGPSISRKRGREKSYNLAGSGGWKETGVQRPTSVRQEGKRETEEERKG